MLDRPIVIFDVETDGLRPDCQITQFAAAGYKNGNAVKFMNVRVQFDVSKADEEALKLNHYSEKAWKDAITREELAANFSNFLRHFKCIKHVSQKTGKPYEVAQLCGYNAIRFDGFVLKRLYEELGLFLPADPRILDVMQLIQWLEVMDLLPFKLDDYKLETVSKAFKHPEFRAHDASADVLALIKIIEDAMLIPVIEQAELMESKNAQNT